MAKKSLYELQYENAKIENDVNYGCGVVSLICLAVVAAFALGLVMLAFA